MPSASSARPTNAAWSSTVWGKPLGAPTRPNPGASQATARPRRPAAASSGSQSAPEPGLPCRNTTASRRRPGPASRSGRAHAVDAQLAPRGPPRPASLQAAARGPRSDAAGDRGAHQARRALAHADHGDEGAGHDRVVLGGRVQAAHVGVDRRAPRRAAGRATSGSARSAPVESCQAWSIGAAAAAKKRRAEVASAPSRQALAQRDAPRRRRPSSPARRWG